MSIKINRTAKHILLGGGIIWLIAIMLICTQLTCSSRLKSKDFEHITISELDSVAEGETVSIVAIIDGSLISYDVIGGSNSSETIISGGEVELISVHDSTDTLTIKNRSSSVLTNRILDADEVCIVIEKNQDDFLVKKMFPR